MLQTTFSTGSVTNKIGYITVGNHLPFQDPNGFGFKIISGNLYALVWENYVETTSLIEVFDSNKAYAIRARYIDADNEVNFWIDGVLVKTMSMVPAGFSTEVLFFWFYLETLTTNPARLYISDVLSAVDRLD